MSIAQPSTQDLEVKPAVEAAAGGVIHDPYTDLRRTLLPAARVRELSQLRPARPVLDALGCWATIILAWTMVALWPAWWSVLIALPIIGCRYYALFIIGHDGLHRRLFESRRRNDLFNDVFVFGPIGAITRLNRHNHLTHHRRLACEDDPDRHKYGCFNKAVRMQLLAYITGVGSIFRSVYNVFFNKHHTTVDGVSSSDADSYQLRDLLILVSWQFALIGGLTLAIGWWAYPVLWLAPVYLFTYLGDNLRSFLEHSQPQADVEADANRLITYTSSPLERLFLAPMNMNFHAVHHLWPSIPYYNLAVADREVAAESTGGRLQRRGSYLRYLWHYNRHLPLRECQDSFADLAFQAGPETNQVSSDAERVPK